MGKQQHFKLPLLYTLCCACSCIFFEEETVHEIVMQKITLTSQIPTFRDKKNGRLYKFSCFWFSRGGSVAFCLKVCDILAQQDEFSATLRSCLLVCKVHN